MAEKRAQIAQLGHTALIHLVPNKTRLMRTTSTTNQPWQFLVTLSLGHNHQYMPQDFSRQLVKVERVRRRRLRSFVPRKGLAGCARPISCLMQAVGGRREGWHSFLIHPGLTLSSQVSSLHAGSSSRLLVFFVLGIPGVPVRHNSGRRLSVTISSDLQIHESPKRIGWIPGRSYVCLQDVRKGSQEAPYAPVGGEGGRTQGL
jgi:hypothetical protein